MRLEYLEYLVCIIINRHERTYLDFEVFFKMYYQKGADINILMGTEHCSIKTFVNECFNLLFINKLILRCLQQHILFS